MKKLQAIIGLIAVALFVFIPTAIQAQTAPPAPGNGVYILVDTSYQVGTIAQDTTVAKLWFNNTTATKVAGVQFRVWYDKNAFGGAAPVVTSLNTSFVQYMQYQPNTANGYITITLAYTGSSSTFTIPNGELFKLKFFHSANFQNYYGTIDSLEVTGVQAFPNMAATNAGMDTTLTAYSYGGAFDLQMLDFHGRFKNVTGSGAKNLNLSLQRKPKTGSVWTQFSTYSTDTTGYFAFSEPIDTTYWDVRLAIQGDTMGVGNVISTADAHLINQWVLGQATPTGFDFFHADVNGSNDITIADAWGVFGRISGRFAQWPNSVKDIKFFTQTEYNAINGSSSNLTATYPGVTNFTYQILPGQPDSVTFYVMVPGDANETGYHMARMTPIKIINPNNAPNYIIDKTVTYDIYGLETMEINFPSLSVDEGNLVNVPVKVYTPVDLTALQLAIKYDTTLLEFKALQTKSGVAFWQSFFNPNGGVVEWGGYDPSGTDNVVKNEDEILNLQFLALKPKPEWMMSPLYVADKYAGDPASRDMNITPANGIIEVKMIQIGGGVNVGDPFQVLAFPNPTTGYVTIMFNVVNEGETHLGISDINGRMVYEVLSEKSMPTGRYMYSAELGNLPTGSYLAVLKTPTKATAKTIIKQ